jgi:putative transposase
MNGSFKNRLPRLQPEAYQGSVAVHWTMSVDRRRTGWLDALLHARLREALVHGCARYEVVCPAYVLMPDHAHFLFLGISLKSDQLSAVRLLRREFNKMLRVGGWVLQKQAYDHVLRPEERNRNALDALMRYIFQNPVRRGLVDADWQWPYSGVCVPGYPSLQIDHPKILESFWHAHAAVRKDI